MKKMKEMISVLFLATILSMVPCALHAAVVNIIPMPVKLSLQRGEFRLPSRVSIGCNSDESRIVGDYLAKKIKTSTGYVVTVSNKKGVININIDPRMQIDVEGYKLKVGPKRIMINAKTGQGAFHGVQTLLQLLPAEIESDHKVDGVAWVAQCCDVEDYPRFGYRGLMLDPCRHFITVENVKKQIDVIAALKMNTLHLHLTDDQGWRVEIKKYPKLTTIGSTRHEADGTTYGNYYYTQDQLREIVDYAAQRFVTVIPEIDLPGHFMAAIAAYPELSCTGIKTTPRIVWGIEDIVMCPGKEDMFEFLEEIFRELAPLFPGKYFHIGGDECPKKMWKTCPACQKRIKDEGLQGDEKRTAEDKLQSYVVKRVAKMLEKHGKTPIGWDEVLEGGISGNVTVMSWRGIKGGVEAAQLGHDVIMSPGSNGMYLDHYQGDSKVEPITIPSPTRSLELTYSFDPVPDVIKKAGLDKHIMGVQCNYWAEYMYSNAKMEYMMYPRVLAAAEVGWSPLEKKNFEDFCKRVDAFCVRLDNRQVNYHIPLPEQPYGSCDRVVITKDTTVTFKTSRPMRMVYTLDGTAPTANSTTYTEPIRVSHDCVISIATITPYGKMSKVRNVQVVRKKYTPAVDVKNVKPGLKMKRTMGYFQNLNKLEWSETTWETSVISALENMKVKQDDDYLVLRGEKCYAAIAEGYVNVPEDGVYYVSSRVDQVWMDGKLLIDNTGEVKALSRHDNSVALSKGLHPVKFVFIANITGGWPSWWNNLNMQMRKDSAKKFINVSNDQFFYED